MSYANNEFWYNYKQFARESHSRHTKAVELLAPELLSSKRVLDLGCGQALLGSALLPKSTYVGVDLDPPAVGDWESPTGPIYLYRNDYRYLADLARIIESENIDYVVSFFSLDVVNSLSASRAIKEYILLKHPRVKSILSTGFYYDDHRRDEPVVFEVDNSLSSYQVPKGHYPLNLAETRLEFPAPSTLFGDSAVEVFIKTERK